MEYIHSNHCNLIDVVSVKTPGDFVLELVFSDGKKGTYDLKNINHPFLRTELLKEEVYRKAYIESGVVKFNERADIAPEFLYENLT